MSNTQFFLHQTNKFKWSYLPIPLKQRKGAFEGEFIIMINNQCKSRKLLLIQNYLCCYTKKGVIKWFNYENSVIEQINNKMMGPGIKLQSGSEIILFGEIEIWLNYMRMWCIQTGFFKTYKLLDRIGKGNQAEVFLCKYINGDNQFAVKLYQKHKIISQIDGQALKKEISILRQVQHENIIHIYEVYESEETIYIVMELLKGGDLQSYIKTYPPLNEKAIALFIYKLLKSLFHINKFGIIHRDIKPQNIILREKKLDQFCISDFGLADYYNKEGKYLFTRCGTPGYVAPEILRDELYDFKVDVFSIGVILYILIFGEEPFQGDYNETIQKNYNGEVDVTGAKFTELGVEFLKQLLSPKELRPTPLEALNHQWFKKQKIVKEQFRIKVTEPFLKVPSQKESTKECFSNNLLLKPVTYTSCSKILSHRLSPIVKSYNNSPNPSLNLKRKSLR